MLVDSLTNPIMELLDVVLLFPSQKQTSQKSPQFTQYKSPAGRVVSFCFLSTDFIPCRLTQVWGGFLSSLGCFGSGPSLLAQCMNFSCLLFPNHRSRQVVRYLSHPSSLCGPGSRESSLWKWLGISLSGAINSLNI